MSIVSNDIISVQFIFNKVNEYRRIYVNLVQIKSENLILITCENFLYTRRLNRGDDYSNHNEPKKVNNLKFLKPSNTNF